MFTSPETEWKQSTLHPSQYKVTVLPRGSENSHEEFRIDPSRRIGSKRGRSKEPSAEDLKAQLIAQENKITTEAITE
jgi:hypothetical protein